MKLLSAIKSLITEGASIDDIKKSIEQRQVVSIYYEGDEPGGKGLREIEPVALGRSKAGNLVLRGWDRTGASHTAYKGEQPLPSWRLFRVDKIVNYYQLKRHHSPQHTGLSTTTFLAVAVGWWVHH